MNKTTSIFMSTSLLIVLVMGCSPQPEQVTSPTNVQALASVNGEIISQQQFDVTIGELLGEQQRARLNETAKTKMLEGMIASKAMSQQATNVLTSDVLQNIELRIQAYKEKLLINEYVKEYADPQPVTAAMVAAYYQANLSEFGAVQEKSYELLIADKKPAESGRQRVFAQLKLMSEQQNWQIQTDDQKSLFSYRSGIANRLVLDSKLMSLIDSLTLDQTSALTLVNGKPMIARVNAIRELPAKPLHQVSTAIRQKLLPQRLKAAIKKLNDEIISNSNVEYLID